MARKYFRVCVMWWFAAIVWGQSFEFCPVSTGTNFCQELLELKQATVQELERLNHSEVSNSIAGDIRENAPVTLKLLDLVIDMMWDGVEPEEIPIMIQQLEKIYQYNYLARYGYYRHVEKKEVIPELIRLLKANIKPSLLISEAPEKQINESSLVQTTEKPTVIFTARGVILFCSLMVNLIFVGMYIIKKSK